MAALSIIEWIAYGIPAYGALVMLLLSMIRDIPATRALSAVRLFCAIPGMIAAALLAPAGPNILFSNSLSTTTTNIINATSGAKLTNATSIISDSIYTTLSGPSWYYFHWMIFAILFVFIVWQIFQLLIKAD